MVSSCLASRRYVVCTLFIASFGVVIYTTLTNTRTIVVGDTRQDAVVSRSTTAIPPKEATQPSTLRSPRSVDLSTDPTSISRTEKLINAPVPDSSSEDRNTKTSKQSSQVCEHDNATLQYAIDFLRPSSCPDEALWLRAWLRHRPSSLQHLPVTVVDVGANKGWVILELLHILLHNSAAMKLGEGGDPTRKHTMAIPRLQKTDLFEALLTATAESAFPGRPRSVVKPLCGACCNCLVASSDEDPTLVRGLHGLSAAAITRADKAMAQQSVARLRQYNAEEVRSSADATDYTTPIDSSSSQMNFEIHAFEPVPSNCAFLRNFFKAPTSDLSRQHVHVHCEAVSNETGAVSFPNVPFGSTTFGLEDEPAGNGARSIMVPRVTLDATFWPTDVTVPRAALPFIDFLLTDVEGHDEQVGLGASRLFAERRVGVYAFEAHKAGQRKDIAWLKRHVEQLHRWGYRCLVPLVSDARNQKRRRLSHSLGARSNFDSRLIGRRGPSHQDQSHAVDGASILDTLHRAAYLLPISGGCWREEMEQCFHGWSNMVCILEEEDEDALRWRTTAAAAAAVSRRKQKHREHRTEERNRKEEEEEGHHEEGDKRKPKMEEALLWTRVVGAIRTGWLDSSRRRRQDSTSRRPPHDPFGRCL